MIGCFKRNRIIGCFKRRGLNYYYYFLFSLPNKRQHFNSCFCPSRLKTQFHDHLTARTLFNNFQLCSQPPSPQREFHRAAWTAAGSLVCVCSVTLISSMSMFPPSFAGYNTRTSAATLIIQEGIVQQRVYSVSLAQAFSLQFVTQFTQTQNMERLSSCVWCRGTTWTLLWEK